ncbi:PP2C family protein-serine/threonine phosphatase [Actinomadura hibisca]|uniref:PP2C family protein-serine/threonine phosphatase n=1 Tax=Actinomadura hibisca TaxID=68565 RepID=UPI000A8937E5|nr:SpoIIE family protein phosphatase [Actinomadura hibisca]
MHSAPSQDLEHAIWGAQPHELLAIAVTLIKEYAGAAAVEALLVDYRQAFLIPATAGGDAVRLDNTAPGHAFAAQQVVREGDALHLPLTVHGDRLGVLTVRLSGPNGEADAGTPRAALGTVTPLHDETRVPRPRQDAADPVQHATDSTVGGARNNSATVTPLQEAAATVTPLQDAATADRSLGDTPGSGIPLPDAVAGTSPLQHAAAPPVSLDELQEQLAVMATILARALKIADVHTDLYRRVRRRSRLTLAAEMQWDLLPGRACGTDEFLLAGQLEPAYAVWGDNFDWAVSPGHLTLTVTNGMGSGTEAAALTHLAISSLRNARRSGADIVEQAALADQTLYAHHRGVRHVATILLDFELATGRVRVIDAGSPKVYRLRGNVTEALDFEAQLPLGMFGDANYAVEEFTVEPGDRLIIVSDGVHGAESAAGELYGNVALLQALRDTRLQNPPEAVRTFIRHFLDYHGDAEPKDDAVVVCVDWTGKRSASESG